MYFFNSAYAKVSSGITINTGFKYGEILNGANQYNIIDDSIGNDDYYGSLFYWNIGALYTLRIWGLSYMHSFILNAGVTLDIYLGRYNTNPQEGHNMKPLRPGFQFDLGYLILSKYQNFAIMFKIINKVQVVELTNTSLNFTYFFFGLGISFYFRIK